MLETPNYALLATNAYATSTAVVNPNNVTPLPSGWSELAGYKRDIATTGFLANVYKNGNGDIVIAYAGTTDNSLDWILGNVPAATGLTLAPQVTDAAKLYLDVLKANPTANITFTGHSLGGGLASLMSVFFDRQATTFDEAPFEKSADSARVVDALKKELVLNGYALPPAFASYVALDYFAGTFLPSPTRVARESNVSHIYLKDEVLSLLQTPLGKIAATALGLSIGNGAAALLTTGVANIAGPNELPVEAKATNGNGWGWPLLNGHPIDLHYMPLLAAFLQAPEFLAASKATPEVLQKIFTSTLNFRQGTDRQNFLNLMVQQQSNASWNAFSSDIGKLTGELGTGPIKAALVGLDIGLHYGQGMDHVNGATSGTFESAFKSVTGGIQIAPKAEHAEWLFDSLGEFRRKLPTLYSDIGAVGGKFTESAERYTLPTAGAMTVTAAADGKSDFMLGSINADTLSGSDGNDVLIGRGGVDTLDGGSGWDTLIGGKDDDILNGGSGFDRYLYQLGDGSDLIDDSDGGSIQIFTSDAEYVFGGIFVKQQGSETWIGEASNHTVTIQRAGEWAVSSDDGATVRFAAATDLGAFAMKLVDDRQAAPTTPLTITGDILPEDTNPGKAGIQAAGDANGNPLGTAQPYSDILSGSGGNDHILAGELDDDVGAGAGDDWVEGGSGNDWLRGETGNDLIEGGAGRDILIGEAGNDRLYANAQMDITAAIDAGNTDTASGQKGDWLTGNVGDDTLIAGADNDVLAGGAGADLLIAGAGDDNILGDADYTVQFLPENAPRYTLAGTDWYHSSSNTFNWTVTPGANPGDSTVFAPVVGATRPAGGGADVIYAGAGNDHVWAGEGDDYVDGGAGNDTLSGEDGNDNLFGDAGDDVLIGDDASQPLSAQGDDYLDGEDGDDILHGIGGNDTLFGGAGNDQITGGQGNDYLDGEDGADILIGDEGNDELFGGAGNDTLQGDTGNGTSEGNDYLDGETGDDTLLGLGGDDELMGGEGNDQLFGGDGADRLAGDAGNDTLTAEAGDDTAAGGEGNDLVDGGEGNDVLAGDAGQDQLQGGAGDDRLDGGADDDVLFGEAGNDTLLGGAGNDILVGGEGDDLLDGGEGDDIYFAHFASGNDRIVDSGGNDTLVFNDIRFGQIAISVGSLKLMLPDGSEVHLDDFDPDNPYAVGGIEWFQDADGVVLSKAELIDTLGITPTGTPEADVLSGTALSETIVALAGDDVVTARAGNDSIDAGDGADVVYAGDGNDIVHGGLGDDVLLGEAGNDTLLGEAGNDLLAGGSGTDALQGGDGDDTYLFQLGDGQDTATDALGINGVALGVGLTLDSITLARTGNDLWISAQATGDRLTVKDWFAADSHFATLILGDGAVLDRAGVEAALPRNLAPLAAPDAATVGEDGALLTIGNALANDSDPEGRALRVTNPGTYAGTYGTLTLTAGGGYAFSLANTSGAVQALAAGQSVTQSFAYTVSDDDSVLPASASSTISVTVHGANDLPVAQDDFNGAGEDNFFYDTVGNVLANDSDIDAGTVLTVLDPGTRMGAYGTLALDDNGGYLYELANESLAVQSLAYGQYEFESFNYAVSDGIAQVGGTLSIEIAGQNDAPVVAVPLADQTANIDGNWNWQMPTGSFTDIDIGDSLTYDALLADGSPLPDWLVFDAATQSFSGLVPADAADPLEIRVIARDSSWNEEVPSEASDVFTLSFIAPPANHAPILVTPLADQSVSGGAALNWQLPAGSFTDIDQGDTLSYSATLANGSALPSWLAFDVASQTFSGTAPTAGTTLDVTVTASDGHGVASVAADTFRLTVSADAGGGCGHGHGHGNEGPGNGEDPPPPGHDHNYNDGPGTGPGHPGNRHGHGHDRNDREDDREGSGCHGEKDDAPRMYLDPRVLAEYCGSDRRQEQSRGGSRDEAQIFARWLAADQAMSRLASDANCGPAWQDSARGADLGGLSKATGGMNGSRHAFGDDAITLMPGAALKGFKGLQEGVRRL